MRLLACLAATCSLACWAPRGVPATFPDVSGGTYPVDGIAAWASSAAVPRRYLHALPAVPEWPVRYLTSGVLVCLPGDALWTAVRLGDRPRCRWWQPRGA